MTPHPPSKLALHAAEFDIEARRLAEQRGKVQRLLFIALAFGAMNIITSVYSMVSGG